MKYLYNGIIFEAKNPHAKVWYHGTTVDFSEFDPKYAHVESSNAQYGPGFYMTTDLGEALMYAGDSGFVKEIKLVSRQFIKMSTRPPSSGLVNTAFKMLPPERFEDVLSNWAENPSKAKMLLRESLMDQDNVGEQLQSIWYDCYKGVEDLFCAVAARYADGVVFPRPTTPVLVGYNPKNFKIVKTHLAKDVLKSMSPEGIEP